LGAGGATIQFELLVQRIEQVLAQLRNLLLGLVAGAMGHGGFHQLPITPPSFLVMTMVAERGRWPAP
jgi:hypothetical protein